MGVHSFPKTFTLFILFWTLCCQQAFGQRTINDNFADGDFTNSPAWSGTSSHYLVNAGNELQLNNVVAGTSYLSTPFAISNIGEASWEFTLHHNFSGSSTNYSRVYLMSSSADLTASLNGYYLQFGESLSNDAVELFRQTGNSSVSVVRGVNASIASAFTARIRVTRDNEGTWQLFADYTGGTNFVLQGSGVDNTFSSTAFFGIRSTYSVTNANDVFLDNILVSANQAPDVVPPAINDHTVVSSTTLDLHFTEPLDTASVENINNYVLKHNGQNPVNSSFQSDQTTVRLTFDGNFRNGVVDTLIVMNIQDTTMNSMDSLGILYLFFQPVPATTKDIIITELFPDPSPTIGLPEAEFVELYNRSDHPFNLKGWKITDGTSTGTLDSLILLPNEYCIVTANASIPLYSAIGKTVHTSTLPSLNNAGDHIRLRDPTNQTIDSVSYTSLWYRDEEKDLGGWTLELIDPQNVCISSENWRASVDSLGGTPGHENSVFEIISDDAGPRLISILPLTENLIRLDFDEATSSTVPQESSFDFMPALDIDSIYFPTGGFASVFLLLNDDLDSVTNYAVQLNNIFDCPGNIIQPQFSSISFKLDSIPPLVDSVEVQSASAIVLYFSEAVNEYSAENALNYLLNQSDNPVSAVLQDGNSVVLSFSTSFTNGLYHRISSQGVSDFAGNESVNTETEFLYFVPFPASAHDVVITEIFSDPTPTAGLPEAEFIEIFNRSDSPFQLDGWTISDATSTVELPSKILLPNDYLIFCSTTNANLYDSIGPSLGVVSFPSLNNLGESLVLRDTNDQIIDSVRYQTSWYHDDEKKDGGWTIERIDPNNVCSGGENWKASTNSSGGTPGQQNSVNGILLDSIGPILIGIEAFGNSATLSFNEPLNKMAPEISSVAFSPLAVDSLYFSTSDRMSLTVMLNTSIDSLTIYNVSLSNIFDCPGNPIQPNFSSLIFKLDTIPPIVSTIRAISQTEVDVEFSEPVQMDLATEISNYSLNGPFTITSIQPLNDLSVRLVFSAPFLNGVLITVEIENITDRSGNLIQTGSHAFLFFEKQKAAPKDVVISEIFADPTPSVGLPEYEFLEVYNRSSSAFNLKDWTLSDGTTTVTLDSLILPAGQFLILCSNAAKNPFDSLGFAFGVSGFPTLANNGETLLLKDEDGLTIDSVTYNLQSYQDQDKKDGGWSIELIDPDDFCSAELNFTASIGSRGGTPGAANSTYEEHIDIEGPRFLAVTPIDEDSLIFELNERLENHPPRLENVQISNGLLVSQLALNPDNPNQYVVKTQSPLDSALTYVVTLDSVRDCPGNFIQNLYNSRTFRLDSISPGVDSVQVTTSTSIRLYFSESIQSQLATDLSNYLLNDSVRPISAESTNGKTLELTFADEFFNGVQNQLEIFLLNDFANNPSDSITVQFLFYQYIPVEPKDIIITEVFADPTPTIGLPEAEYLEIYNRSDKAIHIGNWKVLDATTIVNLPSVIIPPDQYLILCAAASAPMFEDRGKTIGLTNFPSLNNTGEAIVLKNDLGETIDSVFYALNWHDNADAKDGGYALEIIDVDDFCRGSENWTTSLDSIGGTPGRENSVHADYQDFAGPMLLTFEVLSKDSVQLVFDERLDLNAANVPGISVGPTNLDIDVRFADAGLTTLILISDSSLDSALTYTISIDSISDCYGNAQQSFPALLFKLDSIPPSVDSVVVMSSTTVAVFFSEQVQNNFIQNVNNYLLSEGIHPETIEVIPGNRGATLHFEKMFNNGLESSLQIIGISDPAGNQMQPFNTSIFYYQYIPVDEKDIIISEVFADPSPVVGLPESEFLEIYNRSEKAIQLKDWTLSDATSTSNFPSRIILPGEYVIVCAATKITTWQSYGKAVGITSFPSLNNSGEKLVLKNEFRLTIDSIQYSTDWYHNAEKKDGGYSLEIMDVNDFCRTEENWSSSVDSVGGTPGRVNSINSVFEDLEGPRFLSVSVVSPDTLDLIFNEALAKHVPEISAIQFDPLHVISNIAFLDQRRSTIQVVLEASLDSLLNYQIKINTLYDCQGNVIDPGFSTVSFKMDTIPPKINQVTVLSMTEIRVTISEQINNTKQNPLNFIINESKHPSTVTLIGELDVLLTFNEPLENGTTYTISIKNLEDYAGNVMIPFDTAVLYFVPSIVQVKDVVITELLADPSPVVFLPEAEYVEIFNRSVNPINLEGWKLSDGTSSATLPARIIKSHEYLIICQSSKADDFKKYGSVLGVSSFPSFNNSGETVYLKTIDGTTIDSLSYSLASYHDDSKNDGGYSLELIDLNNFCRASSNWTASTSELGGTPGAINSVAVSEMDVEGPKLLSASAEGSLQINLLFDESLSTTTPSISDFTIEPMIELSSVEFKPGSLQEVELHLAHSLDSSLTYNISVQHVTDCPGNLIQEEFSTVQLKIDDVAPSVKSLKVISQNEIQLEFSERIDSASLRKKENYRISPNALSLSEIVSQDGRIVNLFFNETFQNAFEYEIEVSGILDRSLNRMDPVSLPFMFFQEAEVNYRDIRISEIFADPSPVVSLPEVEFVEIYNRSQQPVNLMNWTLSDGSQISTLGPKIIMPNQHVILCLFSQVSKLTQFGDVLGISNFPSLNNAEDLLIFKNALNTTIDSVWYSDTWYHDDDKKDGGWTLELIDPANVCAEASNWIAAESSRGGTPGEKNSVFEEKPDFTGPTLLSAVAVDSFTIKLSFNEKLNVSLGNFQSMAIEPAVSIESIHFTDLSLTEVELKTTTTLEVGTTYELRLFDVADCAGNLIQSEYSSAGFALPEEALPNDLVINEILFNPTSTGVDFVELYNRSEKFVNLHGFGFANVNDDEKSGWRGVANKDLLLSPQTYAVFTSDPDLLAAEYIQGKKETFHVASLPSLPDDEGSIFLIDNNGVVIDSLFYSKDMHSPFLKDEEGVSLERIGFSTGIDAGATWKSASSASGFATPGYLNSNAFEQTVLVETVAIEPEVFSPYFGQPDFAKINYQFDQGGYIANVRIIDVSGREIKTLAKNELLGAEGFLRWDGDSENGGKARVGAYTVLFELFDLTGNVQTIRKRVVVAGEF